MYTEVATVRWTCPNVNERRFINMILRFFLCSQQAGLYQPELDFIASPFKTQTQDYPSNPNIHFEHWASSVHIGVKRLLPERLRGQVSVYVVRIS